MTATEQPPQFPAAMREYLPPEPYCLETLCDRLQSDGFALVSGLFSVELLQRLYEEVRAKDAADALTRAQVGRGRLQTKAPAVRRDKTQWIEGETLAQTQFLEQLESLRFALNRELMLGLFAYEAHYAVYHRGDFYARHSDSFRGAKNRILSLVVYLNPQWMPEDGGCLALYRSEDDTEPAARILPEYGHSVIFLSEEVPHEVLAANRTRYSIAAWFRCQSADAAFV